VLLQPRDGAKSARALSAPFSCMSPDQSQRDDMASLPCTHWLACSFWNCKRYPLPVYSFITASILSCSLWPCTTKVLEGELRRFLGYDTCHITAALLNLSPSKQVREQSCEKTLCVRGMPSLWLGVAGASIFSEPILINVMSRLCPGLSFSLVCLCKVRYLTQPLKGYII